MLRALHAALLAIALTQVACPQSCQQVTPTGDEIADCAKEAGQDIFHTLLPRISTIIATGPNYGTIAIELAKFVAEYGVDAVTCVVDKVRSRNTDAAAVASGDEKDLHERSAAWAEQWLKEKGAKIKGP